MAFERARTEQDEPTYFCPLCRDEPSGWRFFWCPGRGQSRDMVKPATEDGTLLECGRREDHKPHAYVDRCECHLNNPVVARRRERFLQRMRDQHDGDRYRRAS